MSIETMKLAREVIQDYVDEHGPHEKDSGAAYTLAKLDQAIEQAQKQERKYTTTRNAWTGKATHKCNACGSDDFRSEHAAKFHECEESEQKNQDRWLDLHLPDTSPPQRQWVGLNWDDLPEIYVGDVAFTHGAKWAEARLKEKNT